jgi:hypothetical protein
MQVKMRKPNAGVSGKEELTESNYKAYCANGQQFFEKLTHEGVVFGSNLSKGCETFSTVRLSVQAAALDSSLTLK